MFIAINHLIPTNDEMDELYNKYQGFCSDENRITYLQQFCRVCVWNFLVNFTYTTVVTVLSLFNWLLISMLLWPTCQTSTAFHSSSHRTIYRSNDTGLLELLVLGRPNITTEQQECYSDPRQCTTLSTVWSSLQGWETLQKAMPATESHSTTDIGGEQAIRPYQLTHHFTPLLQKTCMVWSNRRPDWAY